MSQYDGKKWITAMVLVVVLLVALAVTISLIMAVGKGAYVAQFAASTVVLPGHTERMTKLAGSSLYPYSGAWNTSAVDQTVEACVATCLGDATCRGFFHHNAGSSLAGQDACYFYKNNNVEDLMGTNVEFSNFFVDDALVFGDELPGSKTDTYLKEGQASKMFRSSFDAAVLV